MKTTPKLIALLLFGLFCSAVLSGCQSVPDHVSDPLEQFDVNLHIPFPTRAPVSTSTPTPAKPTAAPQSTGDRLVWQLSPGGSSSQSTPTAKPTAKPTPVPQPTLGPRDEELSTGSKGNNVATLQSRLIELGYLEGKADGKYGSKTAAAVSLFQEMNGLTATGTADMLTLKFVYANVPTYAEAIAEKTVVSKTPKPSTQDGYALLQRGDKSTDVTKLQTRLRKLGYLDDEADGEFGAVTEKAVKLFQKQLGWETTGVATSTLQSYLYSGSAPKFSGNNPAAPATKAPAEQSQQASYKTLQRGDSNYEVKQLQKRLKELGYFDGDIGGNYLSKTEDAVCLFQRALDLEQTGVATPALQKALFAADAPVYAEKPKATAKPKATPEPEDDGTMRYGDSGDRVRKLQNRLIELGYLDSEATGNYLGKTEAAVLLVQERLGVSKTGIVNKKLYNTLFADDMPRNVLILPNDKTDSQGNPPDRDQVVLKPGDSGSKVKKLQTAMRDLGYYDGEIGGNYKTITTNAVKRMQAALGYEEDGVATYAFMERLLDTSAPTYEETQRYVSLYYGDTGTAVTDMQMRLVQLGFFPDFDAEMEGKFNKKTLAAVQLLQQMRGLQCIDDFASAELQAYLFSDAAYFSSYVEIGG